MGLKAASHKGWGSCAAVWRFSHCLVRKRRQCDGGTVSQAPQRQGASLFSSRVSLFSKLNQQCNACLHSSGDCLVFNRIAFFCTGLLDSPLVKKNVQKNRVFAPIWWESNNLWAGNGVVQKWCENHRKGVSGKLQIYSVIKTSRVRQLTDSVKAEPKHSSCREGALMTEWSYENEMKEHI